MNTKQLRQKILDLAIRGKLVSQDPNDEPASVLLERVRKEKERLIKEGKIKAGKTKATTDKSHYGELPFDVPESWTVCCLDDIGFTNIGLTYKPTDICKDGVPVLRSNNIQDGRLDFSDLVRVNTPISENLVLNTDDILICARNGSRHLVGKCALVHSTTELMTFGAFMAVYRSICNHYIYYFLHTDDFRSLFQSEGISTQINQLTQTMIKQTIIPLPPLAEQQRIVYTVENAFLVIDEIEQNKTGLQSAVATAKSKILSLAISGKLVPQDPTDEPASVLLERIRTEREALIKAGKIKRGKNEKAAAICRYNSHYAGLPESWEIVTLAQITNPLILNDGDWILSENMDTDGDVKLIQLGSVGYMEYIDKGFKYLTLEMFSKLGCTAIHPGYLLVNRLLGDKLNVCLLPEIDGTLITTVDTCWIAPSEYFDLMYLMYSIASPPFQENVFQNSTGSTRKRISKGNLVQVPFAFPPIDEQRRIVTAVEIAFEQLDSILGTLKQ